MKSKRVIVQCLFFIFLFGYTFSVAQAFDPKTDTLKTQSFDTLNHLVQGSDFIGYGQIVGGAQHFRTPNTVPHGKLVNTIQRFEIKQSFKGPIAPINLLITGVEPLPRPSDPLNIKYPGPLAPGSYILFLQKIIGTNYYQLTGGWQGVYPIVQGRSISLYEMGFHNLDQLTIHEFHQELLPILHQ